jgi:methionyl-tRNA synthetase
MKAKSNQKKFYITTPIYYANAKPHIGNAYTTVAADVLARFHRIQSEDVFFLTGTDEHGAKIVQAAEKENKSPKEFCDEIAAEFQMAWDCLNISYNNFIRTTDEKHIAAVQKVLQILFEKKYIYKDEYKGLYCVGCEQFKTESDLVDGKCPDHQKEPELLTEECYFFKLSKFQKDLLKKIESDEFKIEPAERRNEILSFLKKENLRDLAISRKKIKWGIPLPFDENHTAYVWVDAFLNYLTGLGPASSAGRWDGNLENIPEQWPADVHLMSKDILRVHATIWSAILMALNLPLPKKLFIHGFFTIDGQKMSKSLGNVIYPDEMIKKFGVDGTRYLLLSICSFGRDGDISWEKLIKKYNADLANGIGNLIARVVALAIKLSVFGGSPPTADLQEADAKGGQTTIKKSWDDYEENFEKLKLSEVLNTTWKFISFCDKYIEKEKPWEIKDEKKKIEVIYNLLESLRQVAWMILPFMPETADKIFEQLGLNPAEEKKKEFEEIKKWKKLPSNIEIIKGKVLFPRI